jgi:hypothetical protein
LLCLLGFIYSLCIGLDVGFQSYGVLMGIKGSFGVLSKSCCFIYEKVMIVMIKGGTGHNVSSL